MTTTANTSKGVPTNGATWLALLAPGDNLYPWPGVRVRDGSVGGAPARFIAVTPDPDNRFPRARSGEVGLVEGWQLAQAVHDIIAADSQAAPADKRAIVAVIDVTSQAYGRREEALGIHQALAGAAGAYAQARLAGHPVIGLIVGLAMSGAFLAHGYQANRLIALDDPGVMVHAMGKASAARITLRSVEALEALAQSVPPMAYDIGSYASLGLLWKVLQTSNASAPTDADVALVQATLAAALADIAKDAQPDLALRFGGAHRSASQRVRQLLREQWQGEPHA